MNKRMCLTMTVLAVAAGLAGCTTAYSPVPGQPPTAKTYAVYKALPRDGIRLTQVPGVVDMLSGMVTR